MAGPTGSENVAELYDAEGLPRWSETRIAVSMEAQQPFARASDTRSFRARQFRFRSKPALPDPAVEFSTSVPLCGTLEAVSSTGFERVRPGTLWVPCRKMPNRIGGFSP